MLRGDFSVLSAFPVEVIQAKKAAPCCMLARGLRPKHRACPRRLSALVCPTTEILIDGNDLTHRRVPLILVERASVAPPYRTVS